MCLTTPGRIVRVDSPAPELRTAEVDFGIALRKVSLVYLPEAEVGDYIIVQAGFAIRRLAEPEALEALAYARELAAASIEPSVPAGASP
ncbi:MAG TPA: HypC/HybG/HupF family hydrogenase formation chaperone [Thermoplasmata archaeon]|nr:HypC/HybG/HupF family hydrogenase formation chaperone [Thermoplasmata archaeon]